MQINKLFIYCISALLLLLTACVKEFRPELEKYQNLLVVDGMITDAAPPYTIKLSRSTSVYQPTYNPVTGAKIIVSDDKGYSEMFFETTPGIYKSSIDGLQGIPGRRYKIEIEVDNKHYQSDYQMLKASQPITEVSSEIEYQEDQFSGKVFEGLQFKVNTSSQPENTTRYLWKCEETYKFNSSFTIDYTFDGIYGMRIFVKNDSVYTCWRTKNLSKFYTFETDVSSTEITDIPIVYVSTESRRLSIRYSLLVKQYAIDKNAYYYFTKLKEQNEEQGSLYSSQPYQIEGNIYNRSDETEPVLGYFTVAGVSEKRIFVNPPPELEFHYSHCDLKTQNLGMYLALSVPSMWPIYLNESPNGIGVADKSCFDCTMNGGTLERPDFWID